MSSKFVESKESPTGKKASQVASLMDALVKAKGEPQEFEAMCAEVGIKYPGDIQPAMHALEIAGAVKRFTYVESGSTRKKVAYAIVEGGSKDRPSSGSSTRARSKQPASKQKAPKKARKAVKRGKS